MPKIITNNLIIRPFQNADEERKARLVSDLEVKEDVLSIKTNGGYYETETPFTDYVIIHKITNEPIGIIALTLDNCIVEWNRDLAPQFRGQGYGVESLKAILDEVVQPNIGKTVQYIANVPGYWDMFLDPTQFIQPLILESAHPVKYAYANVEHANYPSLSSNLKAGAHISCITPMGYGGADGLLQGQVFMIYPGKQQTKVDVITKEIAKLLYISGSEDTKSQLEHSVITLLTEAQDTHTTIFGALMLKQIVPDVYTALESHDLLDKIHGAYKIMYDSVSIEDTMSRMVGVFQYIDWSRTSFDNYGVESTYASDLPMIGVSVDPMIASDVV